MFWSIKLIILIIQSELNKGILYFITSQVLFESISIRSIYVYSISQLLDSLLNDVIIKLNNHFIPLILSIYLVVNVFF